jgi:hypothetical protein
LEIPRNILKIVEMLWKFLDEETTHHMRAAQRAATTARRKEHQGLPRLTKCGRI